MTKQAKKLYENLPKYTPLTMKWCLLSNNVKNINLITNLFENPGILDILSTCSSAKKFKNFYAQYQVLNNLNIYSDLSDKQLIELLLNNKK